VRSAGVDVFMARAQELAQAFGERFEPPAGFADVLDRATLLNRDA